MINPAPELYFEYDNNGNVINFKQEGAKGEPVENPRYYSKEPGHVGYYEIVFNPFSENYEYVWNPSSYDYESAAFKNPDIQNLTDSNRWAGIINPGEKYADPEYIQQIYELKQTNPEQYYNQLATDLSAQISSNRSLNQNGVNDVFLNQLEQIKDVNPTAYYTAQLDMLGHNIGWNIGQNTSERNAPYIEQIQELAPEAMKAGLSADQINSIVNSKVNASSADNQFFIANKAASGGSGFNLGETLRLVAPVAALAIGAPFLDAALAGGAAAGMAGNAGVGLGSSVPSLVGGLEVGTGSALAGTTAGAAAVPAGGALASLGSLGWTPPAIGGSAGFLAPTLGADVASTGIGLTAASVPSLTTGLELGAAAAGSSLLSNAGDLLKGAQLAKGLLGAGQNPLQAQAMGVQQPQQMQQRQYAGVDYSPILNLLALKSPTRNINSLLG